MNPAGLVLDRILAETFVARVEYHPILTSTNDRAVHCAAEGPGGLPLLIVAERQTAGRGRGSNRWWTGPGSLAMSLLLDAEAVGAARRRSPLVSLAAAIALVEAVAPRLPAQPVGIHWPNDVLAAGRKLAGILVEVLPDGRHIIGIGLNTNNSLADAPAELQQTATTLRELTGREHDQTEILVDLLRRLEAALRQLAAPERIGSRADQLCLQHGQNLTLQLGQRSFTGTCVGIAPDGSLLLDTPAGRRRFRSGTLR
jgi:BirA family biotin operon repressor/biotin-[acetyl-CoA-carboxylase] ligase